MLLLPSMPEPPWQLHPGLARARLWLGALACLAAVAGAALVGAQLLGTLVQVGAPRATVASAVRAAQPFAKC